MSKKYFGTDGIRGTAFSKLNANLSYKLGQAIYKAFKPVKVVIGYDTRQSSPMLAYGVANGLARAGVDVVIAGVLTTPMIAYYSKVNNIVAVMVTASHNPYQDNGLKVFVKGYKMLDEEELVLEGYIDEENDITKNPMGNITLTNEVKDLYESFYETLNIKKTNLKVAIDTANGATYKIAPYMISKYTKNLSQIGNTPDGLNINLECGSTHLEAITSFVKKTKSDIGFSYDGDGDRILLVDSKGKTYDGDMINYIIAKYLKSENLLKKDAVVLTKMSNPGIIKAFNDLGIKVILTDVGDKYVSSAIMENGYSIGGEASGHIILNDLLPSGDGLLVSIYIMKILEDVKMTLEEYTKELELYPLKTVNIKNVNKEVLNEVLIKEAILNSKQLLGKDSLLLVRASGTEPLIRVTVSHKETDILEEVQTRLVELILKLGAL